MVTIWSPEPVKSECGISLVFEVCMSQQKLRLICRRFQLEFQKGLPLHPTIFLMFPELPLSNSRAASAIFVDSSRLDLGVCRWRLGICASVLVWPQTAVNPSGLHLFQVTGVQIAVRTRDMDVRWVAHSGHLVSSDSLSH
jgi:hypothetical protein